MTRDDIIELALQCGIWIPIARGPERALTIHKLCRLATLVAAAEREACAQLVEKNADVCGPNTMLCDVLRGNSAAIRARRCDAP